MRDKACGLGPMGGRYRGALTDTGSLESEPWGGVCELAMERIRSVVSLLASWHWDGQQALEFCVGLLLSSVSN